MAGDHDTICAWSPLEKGKRRSRCINCREGTVGGFCIMQNSTLCGGQFGPASKLRIGNNILHGARIQMARKGGDSPAELW